MYLFFVRNRVYESFQATPEIQNRILIIS